MLLDNWNVETLSYNIDILWVFIYRHFKKEHFKDDLVIVF